MSRSRFGGFFRGRRLVRSFWSQIKTPSAPASPPDDITELKYTETQGIWKIRATTEFPKNSTRSSSGGDSSPSYTTGFSDALDTISGESNAWTQHTVDISDYAGATVRLVFEYINGTSGESYRGDIQLDAISLDGTTYGFESTVESFETSIAYETSYDSVSWNNVATSTSSQQRFNRDSGGTGSSQTGRTDAAAGSFYLYAETSGSNASGSKYWVRSPQVTLGSSPTLTYYEARYGNNIGTLNVYLDVIS